MTLQNLEDDSLQFDLSAETLEELFEWYQVAWDITQRELSKEYNRQHEVSSAVCVAPLARFQLTGSRTHVKSERGCLGWASANRK